MEKKGLGSVIVIVLIVLITLVIILIAWNVVAPLIKQEGGEADIGRVTASLDIEEAVLFETGASKITVSRGAGEGDITALKFIFYDEYGNSGGEEKETTLSELGTEMYSFSPFSKLGKIKRVAVVPVLGKNLGIEVKAETKELLEIPSGIVSWWRFEDSNDFVGVNNCGLVNIAESERGKVGSFNGEGISCGAGSSLDILGEIALGFWIKTSSQTGEIIKKGENYKISLQDGKIDFAYGNAEIESAKSINDDSWHYVAATMTGIYIDGEPDISKIIDTSGKISAEEIKIGNFNGALDEVMLFKKGLANTEIKGIFNNQKI